MSDPLDVQWNNQSDETFISMHDSDMAMLFDYNMLNLRYIDISIMSRPHCLNQITHGVRVRDMDEFIEANDAMAFSDRFFTL
jgi:hypothetical protein